MLSAPSRSRAAAARRALLALVAVALPSPATAQAPAAPLPPGHPPVGAPALQPSADAYGLKVTLWPEYDRPAVLVMLDVQLPAGAPGPAVIGVPIPGDVGAPHAVARRGPDGSLLMAEHSRVVEGDWAMINVTTDSGHAHVEYYAPIATDKKERTFAFQWPGTATLTGFDYEVQQPLHAATRSVEPAPSGTHQDRSGLNYATGGLGAQPAGQAASLTVKYTMKQNALTREAPATPPPSAAAPPAAVAPPMAPGGAPAPRAVTPTPPPARAAGGTPAWITWLLGAAVVVLAGIVIFRSPRKNDS